jgi:hypothetical protein
MDFPPHEIRRVLIALIPVFVITGLTFFRRWLSKRDEEISATLQRRDN